MTTHDKLPLLIVSKKLHNNSASLSFFLIAGLGTPNYGKMHQILVSLGSEINGAFDAPTAAPTVLLKDQPSTQPTSRPSTPTHTPTARPSGPSFSPSFIPSRAPVVSRSPTLRPTRRPTLGPTISISPSIGPTKIFITGEVCICMCVRVHMCTCVYACMYFVSDMMHILVIPLHFSSIIFQQLL